MDQNITKMPSTYLDSIRQLSNVALKLSFTNIQGLCLTFVDCESFLQSNSPDILALCETNLDDSINSGNFSVKGYLPLIRKNFTIQMHGFSVYVKTFAQDLFLENSADSYVFNWLYFIWCLTSFSSPSSSLCTVFD